MVKSGTACAGLKLGEYSTCRAHCTVQFRVEMGREDQGAQCGVERGRGEVVAFYNLPGRPLGEEPTTSRVLTKH